MKNGDRKIFDKGEPVRPRDADFTVLMLGQRRTGKSSVLSSMITSMEKICGDTGFRFTADDDTKILMKTILSQLQNIFHAFKEEDLFSTMEGFRGDVDFGVQTDADITYRFLLEQVNTKKKAKTFVIDFIDVRGESMTEDFSSACGPSVNDLIMRSGVLMIAVDAPALMEGRIKDGVGEYHKSVNLPDDIINHITAADIQMRQNLKKKQTLLPRLVLFVPLKCEKYYFENRMEELNRRIMAGYKNLITFFEANREYTVAITPILTLGDVVFDHYQTRTVKGPGGMEREVAVTFGDSGPRSMRTVPRYPMFRFRTSRPKFTPRYCEQPLLYTLAYVSSLSGLVKEKSGGMVRTVVIWAAVFFFFGGLGLIGGKGLEYLLKALNSNPELQNAVDEVIGRLKTDGDGYQLVYDNLGLGKEQRT